LSFIPNLYLLVRTNLLRLGPSGKCFGLTGRCRYPQRSRWEVARHDGIALMHRCVAFGIG
jgi:hypothetical protein